MRMIQNIKAIATATMLITSLLLSACGQKGPLMLPPSDSSPKPLQTQIFPEDQQTINDTNIEPQGIQPYRESTKK